MSEAPSKQSTLEPPSSDEGSGVSSPPLEAEHLSRAIVGKVITNNIGVQVHAGEILAVVGPSGSGKSSFLRLLNRLDEPTGGVVRLNGQDYRALAPEDLRRRVGMVTQAVYLFPGTVADNVAYGPRQRRQILPVEEVAALLQRVGLSGYQERDVSNLSGGETQRVSIARTSPADSSSSAEVGSSSRRISGAFASEATVKTLAIQ
jgi:putative ABC transport system ATP-binding protein